MRLIGHAERALQLMKDRANSRVAFGKPLVEHGETKFEIARSRLEIDQARLLVLKSAFMIDDVGTKAAAAEIAMIKIAVPNMALRVLDRAIQIHGAKGLSNDTPLAMMYGWARALRFADGPDEVHLASLAKHELSKL
jgi:alkylation response protein AidB-like acyl-CoA dehydrogenase